MKVKVTRRFIDKVESKKMKKRVIRAVGDEFTVPKSRFDELMKHGDFVKEVKTKSEPRK